VLNAAERAGDRPDNETMRALVDRRSLVPLFT